jgi:dihydropteroate synthase
MFGEAIFGNIRIGINHPVRIMGVINLSPESFYRGSIVKDVDSAVERAIVMVEGGADIIDIGGMSTAPYKDTYISPEEEIERVVDVIKEVSNIVDVPISIDTQRSVVAAAALNSGATIVNDVTGLKGDPNMVSVVKDFDASIILMAYGEIDTNNDPIVNIRKLLNDSLNICRNADIDLKRIVIDPGIGFFRNTDLPWYDWDSSIIRNLYRLHILGRPILVGISRKSFIGAILDKEKPEDRLYGSIASEALAVYNGASIIRTHDVLESRDAIRMAEYIRPKINKSVKDNVEAIDITMFWKSEDLVEFMMSIDVDTAGARIMCDKGVFKIIYLKEIPKLLSVIIKQELLAVGGEAAIPHDAIFSGFDNTDIIIMGTKKQLKRLVEKLKMMEFDSLKERGLINSFEIGELIEVLME